MRALANVTASIKSPINGESFKCGKVLSMLLLNHCLNVVVLGQSIATFIKT